MNSLQTAFLGVGGAAVAMALIASAVSLWFHYRAGSVRELVSNYRQLELDVSELYDKVDHWTRRERVRRFRDGKDAAAMPEPAAPTDRKAALRAKVSAMRGLQ